MFSPLTIYLLLCIIFAVLFFLLDEDLPIIGAMITGVLWPIVLFVVFIELISVTTFKKIKQSFK
jgi:hypothetical protein